MKPINYLKGDVRNPIAKGNKIIIHVANDIFVMGAGVALAIIKKWPTVLHKYKEWGIKDNPKLGDVQFVKVENDIVIGNMLGQRGIKFLNGIPPIRYEAVGKALKKVAETAKKYNASVHLPYNMGSGLAGGEWNEIEKMIIDILCQQDIDVYVYDFNNARKT